MELNSQRLIQRSVDPSFSCGRKECPFSTRWKEKLAASAQVSRFKMKCLGWNHGENIQLNAVIFYRKDHHCFTIPRSRVSGDIHLLRWGRCG